MIYDEVKRIAGTLWLPTDRKGGATPDIKGLIRARKRVIRVIMVAGFLVLLFHRSSWPVELLAHETLTRIGVLLIAIAIAGRTWVWAHLGRRRHLQFVFDGPYSVVRHPLYVFSILGAAGVAAQTGSLIITCLLSTTVWAVFNRVAQVEETDMASRFGEPYQAYLLRTPRFLPNLSLWTAPEVVPVEYRPLIKSLRDASLFTVAVPTFILIDWAQRAGIVPVIFGLP